MAKPSDPELTSSDNLESTPGAPLSGREQEEQLRRKSGRPKSVRPTDFEPQAWESSRTKLDRPELDDDGNETGGAPWGSCVRWAVNALKAAWGRLNVFEMASVATFLIVAVLGLFFFRSLVHSGTAPEASADTSLAALDFPVKGSLLTINEIKAQWREPKPGEIVRPGAYLVPALDLQLGGGAGYLRVLFRDEEGRIRGDALAERVTGGQIAGSPAYSAICSEGYSTSMSLVECLAGRLDPWTVEVYESANYDVTIADWNVLAKFAMPADIPSTVNVAKG